MTDRRPRAYHLDRPDTVGFLRHWSARQAGVGFSGLFLALSTLRMHGHIALRVVMIVVGMTVLGVGLGRAPGGEALLDLAGPLSRFAGRATARRRRFVAPVAAARPSGGGSVPGLFAGLVVHEVDPAVALGRAGLPLAVVEDRSDGTLSAVLRVHGAGFSVADPEDKELRLSAWGRVLADFCRDRHPVVRLAWSQWSAPAGIEEHRLWLAEAMHPDPLPEMVTAYDQVLERVGRCASRSQTLLTLSVAKARVRLLAHHRGDRLLAASEQLLEELELLGRQLRRAELVVGAPLSTGQLARALRERLDPSCAAPLDARGRSLGDAAGLVSPGNAFPLLVEEGRRHLRCDDAYHRAFRVAEWPRSALRADWLRDLLGTVGVVRSLSLIYHPQSRRRSRWEVDSQASRTDAAIEERSRKQHHVGAALRRASSAVEQIDEELERGAGMEHFTGIVVVSATSEEELEHGAERTCQAAANAGMELRALHCRHGAAVAAALPLGRDVREGRRA